MFAVNDPAAIGAMKAGWRRGLRVRDDMSIVGAGDIAHGDMLKVPLTTVSWSSEASWAGAPRSSSSTRSGRIRWVRSAASSSRLASSSGPPHEDRRRQSHRLRPGRNFVTLKLLTEDGISGVGDATLNGRELAVARYLNDHVIPLLIGRERGGSRTPGNTL